QRSISLEPEVKDRKPLERSKSHRKDGDRHNRHHHHHRNNRHQQQQSQAHQQSQQLAKRMYPVAQKDWLRARTYFNDINPYIMDAKKMGNLGRYFNHSCNPNVFVQNVFIDTHDPRFPEVAFFAKRNIEVGEEMTWDYGYTVDAVPFKVLYCYCGEPNCRIRLL
ncbi:Histone-lysine N-methyltransferase eggless, partial [Schistosoma japonicum]